MRKNLDRPIILILLFALMISFSGCSTAYDFTTGQQYGLTRDIERHYRMPLWAGPRYHSTWYYQYEQPIYIYRYRQVPSVRTYSRLYLKPKKRRVLGRQSGSVKRSSTLIRDRAQRLGPTKSATSGSTLTRIKKN